MKFRNLTRPDSVKAGATNPHLLIRYPNNIKYNASLLALDGHQLTVKFVKLR